MISYLFLETGSYMYAKHDIDFQVISAMSLTYMLNQHKEFLVYLILLILLIYVISSVHTNFLMKELNTNYIYQFLFILYLDLLLFYFFMINAYRSLYPFANIKLQDHYILTLFTDIPAFSKLRDDYDRIFNSKDIRANPASLINPNNNKNIFLLDRFKKLNQTVYSQNSKPKRNLIIIQMESVEKQSMGIYNKFFPYMMPFLSNLSQKGTFISNAETQPYTLWTAGAVFSSYCGLPHVISDQVWSVMEKTSISQWPQLPCIPKHFKNVGYNLYYMAGAHATMMGLLSFFKQMGFVSEDASTTEITHDYDFFYYVIEKLFKKKIVNDSVYDASLLNRNQIKEPFVLILENEDTHPFYFVDKRCKANKKYKKVVNCLNCFDALMEKFFTAFESSELFNRTDIFIFGDHPGVGKLDDVYQDQRNLVMFFPYLPKKTIDKKVTIYDIAPTLLSMMGIEYFPPFPYGQNMFDEDVVGKFPVKDEFNFIYNSILGKSNENLKCFKDGNCGDKWEYYKTRQFVFNH